MIILRLGLRYNSSLDPCFSPLLQLRICFLSQYNVYLLIFSDTLLQQLRHSFLGLALKIAIISLLFLLRLTLIKEFLKLSLSVLRLIFKPFIPPFLGFGYFTISIASSYHDSEMHGYINCYQANVGIA
jgi:hypothetical protein